MNSRNAQGLSVNALILAALAILVLIIAALIYTNVTDDSRETLTNCENQGGQCQPSCDPGQQQTFIAACDEGLVCCIGAPSREG